MRSGTGDSRPLEVGLASEHPALTVRLATHEDEGFLFELYASTRKEEIDGWGWNEAQRATFLGLQFRAQKRGYGAQFPDSEDRIIVVDGRPADRLSSGTVLAAEASFG